MLRPTLPLINQESLASSESNLPYPKPAGMEMHPESLHLSLSPHLLITKEVWTMNLDGLDACNNWEELVSFTKIKGAEEGAS